MANKELQNALEQRAVELKRMEAYRLFMSYYTPKEISKRLGLEEGALKTMIYGQHGEKGWYAERAELAKEVQETALQKFRAKKGEYLPDILQTSMALILSAVKTREAEIVEKPMTLQEANVLSSLISNLDKIQRLDAGEVTEISVEKAQKITLADLKKAVEKDYFIQVSEQDTKLISSEIIDAEIVDPFTERKDGN